MRCLVLLATVWVASCVHSPVLKTEITNDFAPQSLTLSETPFFPQQDHQCGPAALATLLNASGVQVTPETISGKIYLPKKRGSLQIELLAATRRQGRIPYVIAPKLSGLIDELTAGRPVLVMQNLGLTRFPVWHYAVVIGFDVSRERIVLRSGARERLEVSAAKFLRTWQRADKWGLVVLRPGEIPTDPDPNRYLKAVSAMEQQGDLELLETAFAAALHRWPHSELTKLGLANAYLGQRRLGRAESLYRELLQRNPKNIPARNNLAEALAQQGCVTAALTEIAAAMEADRRTGGQYSVQLQQTRRGILAGNDPGRVCFASETEAVPPAWPGVRPGASFIRYPEYLNSL